MDFSAMVTKLQSTANIKKEIKTSIESVLTSLGTGITSFDAPFRNYADFIYSIGTDFTDVANVTKFVQSDYKYSVTESDLSSIIKKMNTISDTKIWIRNALRARQIDTSSLSFSDFDTAISSITEDTVRTPLLTMISGESESYKETELVVDGTLSEGESYLYKKTENIPFLDEVLDNTWSEFSETIEAVNGEFVCVCLVNSDKAVKAVGLVQAAVRSREAAGNLEITSVAGEDYNTTSLTIIPELTSGRNYYYKIYNDEEFLEEDIVDLSEYTEWDGTSLIVFGSSDVENIKYLMIEADQNKVINYGIFKPVIKKLPEWYVELEINSYPGSYSSSTILEVSPEKSENSIYYYKSGISFDTSIDLTNFDSTGYEEWDGTSEITLESGTQIYLVEVSNENKVLRGGTVIIEAREKSIEYLTISSTEGTKANETILKINPELDEGNKYLYKVSDQYDYPRYDEIINEEEYEVYNPEDNLIIENGTRIIIIEVTAENNARKAGYVTVDSKKPYIESLLLESVEGSVTGYTKLIVSPEKETLNIYVYMKGTTLLKYNQDVSSLHYWDGTSDINGFEDGDILTLVECTSDYLARKSGTVTIVVKPVELNNFNVYSYKGQNGGCTSITVSNTLKSGNKYKYSFTDELPVLYQDISSWEDWDGTSEIEAENGVYICIAEVNSDNLTVGAGIVKVKAKDPDPVLESLTVTISAGSSENNKVVTVDPELTDGYKYKYSFINELPNYNDDLSSWEDWDGTTEFYFGTNSFICIAEVTSDNYARKAGVGENI